MILLAVAIGYGFVLNRRIVELRQDQKKLEKLSISFDNATIRAEDGVAKLSTATESSVLLLQQYLAKGGEMSDDLKFLIRRGEDLADKLELSVRTAERGPVSPQTSSNTLLQPSDEVLPEQGLSASSEEEKNIPTVAHGLDIALEALDSDRDFLLAGGVFSNDTIDAYIDLKMQDVTRLRMATHPAEFDMYYSL